MVNWKVALVVVIIAVPVMAVGLWFGYRYVSEQDDISPEGWHVPSNTVNSCLNQPFVLASAWQFGRGNVIFSKYCSNLYLSERRRFKL